MGTYSAEAPPREREDGLGLGVGGPGTRPTSGRLRVAAARVPRALLLASLGVAVWLLVDPRTPDLAAQVYRVALFRQVGFALWDARWYAGHDLPGYSLTFAPLATLLGMRSVAALAVLASAALFERLLLGLYGTAARWGALLFALAALGDVWSGRLTFALGVALALAATLALARGHAVAAAALALLCAASSPVAGLLLALAGLTITLVASTGPGLRRGRYAALILGAPAAAVVLALAALFPEGGTEPYPLSSFVASVAVVLAFLCALPRGRRELRVGALVYLAACVACLLVASPMGSNVERYGVLLAGPLLLAALGAEVRRQGLAGGWRGAIALAALGGIVVWTAWGPVRETLAVAGSPATRASYYAPVRRFLAMHGGSGVRVEVPLTRGHWEAAWLAPTVSLARGWEKQLDERYDAALLSPGLTAASYERWLRFEAVSYVALPDAPLDASAAREGRLIRSHPAYLREVFASAHWQIYEVLGATPLASGPGRLLEMGHDSFVLAASRPGRLLVRVHYTPYLTLMRGQGCVTRAPEGWTSVVARAPGTLEVAARFSLSAVLGRRDPCSP